MSNPWARELPAVSDALLDHYLLDPASLWPAKALEVQPGEQVADLCAAPGGKSLALLFDLVERFGLSAITDFRLLCSDQSLARIKRLKSVLRTYLPPEVLDRVEVFHRDASRWGLYESDVYDRVLVDAPCSGERHLLQQPKELKKWSKARSRHLTQRQVALLCSALQILKPGGRLVYSTCTVSPLENDSVIEQFQKKRRGRFKVLQSLSAPPLGPLSSGAFPSEASASDSFITQTSPPHPPVKPTRSAEQTRWGWQIWPDHCQGAGPIYFCVMEKE